MLIFDARIKVFVKRNKYLWFKSKNVIRAFIIHIASKSFLMKQNFLRKKNTFMDVEGVLNRLYCNDAGHD